MDRGTDVRAEAERVEYGQASTMDMRERWPRGPWDQEPDKIEFRHQGMACMMSRAASGHWCGYVAVGPHHPMHRAKLFTINRYVPFDRELNYGQMCRAHVCHVVIDPEQEHDVFWIGFDCGSMSRGDYSPAMDVRWTEGMSTMMEIGRRWGPQPLYKTVANVRGQVEELAERLAALAVIRGG